jgi:DNA-binding NtrC family response regulator
VSSAPGLTIYVPELPDPDSIVQLHLAKLMQESLHQCRLIVALSGGSGKSVRNLLRSDLAMSLSSQLLLPTLSERRTDIAPLALHFAKQLATSADSAPLTFSGAALSALQRYSWPGNVAELARLVRRLWSELGAAVVQDSDIAELLARSSSGAFCLPPAGIVFANLEREVLTQALAMAQNNQTRAASLLGLTRDQLRYRLAKFDILNAATRD